MLSPMDIDGGEMAAPSIYSFDSGYKSESLWEEEGALQGQTIQYVASSSDNRQPNFHQEPIGLGLGGGLWDLREEATIGPIDTKLNVFTTEDTSGDGFYLPEMARGDEGCLECEFWRITNPGENIKCEDCRIPEIIEPAALDINSGGSKGKEPVPRLNIPRQPQGKPVQKPHKTPRCSACELSAIIDPHGFTLCSSCSPNPAFLSPISPSSPDCRVRRSRAGRNSKLPLSALNRLQAWLDANQGDPYPSAETKRLLAQECGITEKQVTTWFTNARARQLKPLDTYLSSGSEDEAAQESDITSAAETPLYSAGGFTYLSDTRAPAQPQQASCAASVASAPTARPGPSRRGKKRVYGKERKSCHRQLRNQNGDATPQLLSPISPTGPTSAPPDQEMWQCTFCYRPLVPKSWRRHEETQHRPKAEWTCMLYGPRLTFPSRTNSSSVCAFCMVKDPSEEHFLNNHRIEDCAKRDAGDRTFYRPDHLRQHVRNFHSASLFDTVQARWKRAADVQTEGWVCGFCQERLESWDKRETHIANHFKDGMTMEEWKEPETDEQKSGRKLKQKQEKAREQEKDKQHGLGIRLSRTFTRRSTRNSQASSQHQIQPQPQPQNALPFANAFASIPTSSSPYGLPPPVSAPPVLPDINMDPLMMDACGNYIDWNAIPTSMDTSMQFPLTNENVNVFDPSAFPTSFPGQTTGLTSVPMEYDNMDLYSNPMDYQGPWDQSGQGHGHQHQ